MACLQIRKSIVLLRCPVRPEGYIQSPGRSAVRLAHLLWEQRVAGSNPVTPTIEKAVKPLFNGLFFIPFRYHPRFHPEHFPVLRQEKSANKVQKIEASLVQRVTVGTLAPNTAFRRSEKRFAL